MTTIEIPFIDDEIVTVRIENGMATCDNPELQKHVDLVLSDVLPPPVNVEPWAARVIVNELGGKIVKEPPFDPNAGDVR